MANKYAQVKKLVDILERLDNVLSDIEESAKMECKVISERVTDEQLTSWRTGELLWEDEEHTIPKMRVEREYGNVPKAELDEDDELTLSAIATIRKALDKLI